MEFESEKTICIASRIELQSLLIPPAATAPSWHLAQHPLLPPGTILNRETCDVAANSNQDVQKEGGERLEKMEIRH